MSTSAQERYDQLMALKLRMEEAPSTESIARAVAALIDETVASLHTAIAYADDTEREAANRRR